MWSCSVLGDIYLLIVPVTAEMFFLRRCAALTHQGPQVGIRLGWHAQCRTIFEKSSPVRAKSLDVLLNEMDLPPSSHKYATEMNEDEYNQEFPQSITRIKMENELVGYVAIIPFYPKRKTNVVIPIPFILDTGAPGVIYWAKRYLIY